MRVFFDSMEEKYTLKDTGEGELLRKLSVIFTNEQEIYVRRYVDLKRDIENYMNVFIQVCLWGSGRQMICVLTRVVHVFKTYLIYWWYGHCQIGVYQTCAIWETKSFVLCWKITQQ